MYCRACGKDLLRQRKHFCSVDCKRSLENPPVPAWESLKKWAITAKPAKRCRRYRPSNDCFMASPEWKALRKIALSVYGYVCMRCGSSHMINVDHIKPKSKFPELALDISNLQILCWPCNKEKSNKDETDYRPDHLKQ